MLFFRVEISFFRRLELFLSFVGDCAHDDKMDNIHRIYIAASFKLESQNLMVKVMPEPNLKFKGRF